MLATSYANALDKLSYRPEVKRLALMNDDTIRWSVPIGDLLPEGRALTVDLADEPGLSAIFLRVRPDATPKGGVCLDDGSVVLAYLNVCTHMGCKLVHDGYDQLLTYRPSTSSQVGEAAAVVGPCSCHGTTFDAMRCGMVVLGPATQNLQQLSLELSDDTLTAKLDDKTDVPLHETWPNS